MEELYHSVHSFLPGVLAESEGLTSLPTNTILIIQVIVFAICLVLSAFFSGSETALTSMSKIRIKRLWKEGEDSYSKLESWLHEPNRYLVTILVGNNFVNILASVIAANLCENILRLWFEVTHAVAYGSALAVGTTTFLLLVFGEIVPKTYCKEHAPQISLLVIRVLDYLYRILRPLIAIFVFLSNTIIWLFGGAKIREVPLITEDDIRVLIEMSEREGVLEEEEREMMHSIIDFGDLHVKEIMTPRVDFQAIRLNLSYDDARREAISKGHSRIPVYEYDMDRIVGILYVKDLLRVDNPEKFHLRDILRPPLFVPKSGKVNELLETFKQEKNHMAIVVDEYGLTAGLVTIEDILEEIVGDIQDEYDEELPEYEENEDGTIVADAKMNLDHLADLLNVAFPEEDVETLGGFVCAIYGNLPKTGEEVEYNGLHFKVLDADERRIKRVKVTRVPRDEENESGLRSSNGEEEIPS